MKNRWLLEICSVLTLGTTPLWSQAQAQATATATAAVAPTALPAPAAVPASADEASQTIGLTMGQQLRQYGVTNEISGEKIVEGLKAGLGGKKVLPADEQRLQAYLRSVAEAAAARNALAAKEYLAQNGKAREVRTTATGLQYRIIEAGDAKAAAPQPTDQVTVSYRGKLLDGTEFDSSYAHGTAAIFRVNEVIQGWQEALMLMKPGAKWQLFVPPDLAYGLAARPGIPGGSLLVYELELKNVKPSLGLPAPSNMR
jgi:FKBP-type peptidyl-prolyl cis-trans isomerase FklB